MPNNAQRTVGLAVENFCQRVHIALATAQRQHPCSWCPSSLLPSAIFCELDKWREKLVDLTQIYVDFCEQGEKDSSLYGTAIECLLVRQRDHARSKSVITLMIPCCRAKHAGT